MLNLRAGIVGLTLTGALALAAVSANAADIYRGEGGSLKDPVFVPVAAWTGLYIGVNGGYGWSVNSDKYKNDAPNLAGVPIPFGGLSPEGGFGGGQVGYNWQGGLGMSRLVFGVEADFQGGDITDSGSDSSGARYRSRMDWFGTARGRVGLAFDRTLVYGTGGFAYGNVNNRVDFGGGDIYKSNETETGYTAGAGVEFKVNPAWSVKAEYQYINLGQTNVSNGLGTLGTAYTQGDDEFHTVRAGLNYHVHNEYVPLK